MTKYILAQPTELQVFTIHDSDGELVVYIVLNDNKKRTDSVSQNFREYQFYETENEPNTMKCTFKTNKTLTAVRETGHTITLADRKIIHKKLASNPLKFQPTKKREEARKPTNRCRRCDKFSQGNLCDTHKRLMIESNLKEDEAGRSKSFPKMPTHETEERTVITPRQIVKLLTEKRTAQPRMKRPKPMK